MRMSASRDVETGLVVDTTSFNDKHPVPSSVHSTCRQATATSMPCPLEEPEPVELAKMASPSLDTPQTELQPNHDTETAPLADRLARLQTKDEERKQSVDTVVSQVSAPTQATSMSLGTFSDSGFFEEGNCDANVVACASGGEALDPVSETQQLLLSAGTEQPENTPNGASSLPEAWWGQEDISEARDQDDSKEELANEIRGLMQAALGDTFGDDGTVTPLSTEKKDGCPPAPPPSPADPAQKPKAAFEEFFEIRRSKLGGLGAFAVRELKKGEIILVERPLLRTTHFRFMMDYYDLSKAAKKAYLSLHGAEDGDRFGRVERIKRFNAFAVPGGIAIFEIASRFNHACPSVRNVQYAFDNELGVMELTVCQEVVPAGTELHISYGGTPTELYKTYGFRCSCGGCTPLTDEDIRRLERQEFGTWKPDSREYLAWDW